MNKTFKDLFTGKMTVNSDMFSAFILNGIVSKMNRGLVVTKKSDRLEISNIEIFKQTNEPNYFRSCRREGTIFCLGGRFEDGCLLL